MLPPTSYTQAILKRAETLRSSATTTPPVSAMTAPPPAYSEIPLRQPLFSIPASAFLDDPDEDEDEELDYDDDQEVEEDEQDTGTAPAPIVIKIDTSLKVEGNGNTVLLPPSTSAFSARPSMSTHSINVPATA